MRYSCQILMKFEFSWQIFFKKCSNIKFHENSLRDRKVVPCGQTGRQADGQTDMTKLSRFSQFL